jgi:hypothetical protein
MINFLRFTFKREAYWILFFHLPMFIGFLALIVYLLFWR